MRKIWRFAALPFAWVAMQAKAQFPAQNFPPGNLVPQTDPSFNTVGSFYNVICVATQWLMVFGLIIGVAFIIYGGVRYITSGGDENKSGDAKKTILTALVGVVFLVLAVALVRIVASFFGATGFSLNLTTATCR